MSHRIPRYPVVWGLVLLLGTLHAPVFAQHHEGHHALAHEAKIEVADDPAAGAMTVRLGPLDLPARSTHDEVAQPPERFLVVPFDGWLIAYHPRLVDGDGGGVPGRLLHHVAFWNVRRADFLCPNKEEHIFGAGGEMNDWRAVPGVGYPVAGGDSIRVTTMFHNPTDVDRPETYLEVEVEYRRRGAEALANVYPAWFDVQECGSSSYDLEPGTNVTAGTVAVPVAGRLLGVGGHLHDYGTSLVLERVEPEKEIARLTPETDERGRLLSMPIVTFFERGGYALEAGDELRVTATYENPTGHRLPDGAMGIVVGYFLPDEDAQMAEFERPAAGATDSGG